MRENKAYFILRIGVWNLKNLKSIHGYERKTWKLNISIETENNTIRTNYAEEKN